MAKGIPPEMDGIEYLPEPTDPRILSAVDPSITGWQDDFRARVTGWEPLIPPTSAPPPRRSTRTIGVWVIVMFAIFMWMAYRTDAPFGKLTYNDSEWAWEDSQIRQLQQVGLNGTGVHICIVDTGFDASHPDLNHLTPHFRDFLNGGTKPVDLGTDKHGTMMAGIIVANGHIKGSSPQVELSVAAALGTSAEGENRGDSAIVADAIDWCWEEQNADIISLSLGGVQDGDDEAMNAVERALSQGVFVVAAAGNDGEDDDGLLSSPANVPLVISVGAVDEKKTIWEGSSQGSTFFNGNARGSPNEKPEIVAPGVSIISTGLDKSYYSSTGTSGSTAFVSGSLALILQAYPELMNSSDSSCIELVKTSLMQSAESVSEQIIPHDAHYGYGILNAYDWKVEVGQNLPC